jgi:predicted nucleic-acid-binding protein
MADAYIVDARVLIQYFLTETNTPQVRVLIGGLARGDRLYVPEFGLLECVNILWRNVRFQGLPQTDGEQMIRDCHLSLVLGLMSWVEGWMGEMMTNG